ncbi:MAG: GNAT family N-acetyltransferase [Eubacteriales bacterium]|nr:GNAT family N-acetyltransferase [Eubacteriales bacterium]
MTVKVFNSLPDDAKKIRIEVFVDEQGFNEEFDSVDNRAIHFVMYDDNGEAAAVCRTFYEDNPKEYHLGRLAVRKKYRGCHLGAELLAYAEEYVKSLGCEVMELSAQVRASEFYAKQGYEKFGDIYLDEYCPHIMMKKNL